MSALLILKERYPQLIADLPTEFDSHDLIALVAERFKHMYDAGRLEFASTADGLTTYHTQLAQGLNEYPHLVTQVGTHKSKNVNGKLSTAAVWRKIT